MIDWSDRFWSKVRVDADGCWRWTAAADAFGYGAFGVGTKAAGTRRMVKAHRYAFELTHGPIPAGHVIRHACDVPACVNPAHLVRGTQADNVRDMHERGRQAMGEARARRGESCGTAKLSESQVAEIRAKYAAGGRSQRSLAAEYGVHQTQISHVVTRKQWVHMEVTR
jgi:hypothetical protein